MGNVAGNRTLFLIPMALLLLGAAPFSFANIPGRLALLTTGDATITEAKNTQESKTKEQTGHGELKLTAKNEYAEIDTAIQAAKASEKNLEKAKYAYDQYKKDLAKQQTNLAQLKQDLADGKLGIDQSDIDELQGFIDDLKGDDAYYQGNIALAASDLASKTAAVAKQMATAAESSGTYGFNVGLEMDLDLLEKRYGEYKEQSVASNLVADNLTINAGKDTTIRGSNLAANDINIETENLNILASQDINTSSNSSEHLHTNVSMTLYGTGNGGDPTELTSGGPASVSASADRSQGGSTDIIHTNSQLQGNNITLTTRDTTTIAGANVAASDTLSIDTKNLNVESVQDSHESRSAGEGINVSGSTATTPGSGGINGSVSHERSRDTVLTTLTGGNVDINVAEETTLTGATIAAVDENGEDNGQLSLTTGTLQVNALSNTATSANVGMGSTVSIDASADTSNSKTKTLGTIGEGNIQVANIDESDTTLLNRDVTDNEVDIYDIESHKGLKGSLDTRFLTEDGRKDVLEDIKRSELLGSALLDVVTEESVRFQDTMQHVGDIQKDLDVQKLLANRDDGVNAKILNDLANATLEEKQQAINAYAAAYAEVYHITIDQALVVTVNAFVGGAHANSGEGSTLYINDYAQNNALDYTNTLGHEVAHAQMAQDSSLDRGDARLNEEYANLRGEYAADNYEFSFSQNDYGPINTGNTNAYVGNTTSETAKSNNTQYYSEDRKNLDFSCEMASPTGSCAQLMHDSAITANMMVGNNERAAELIEADVIVSLMRTGRTEQLEKVLADASPGAVKEALQLQMSMAQEDKATLAAGGVVLAMVAAPAIPEVLAGMAATGRMAAAEIASFASNPVAYCQLNPALCLSIAEEAGYTAAGATTASSMVPHVPASGVRQAAGEAVEAIVGKADDVAKSGKTLVVPKEKANVISEWEQAASEGRLVRTDPKTVRGSGFRKRLTDEQGPPPGDGYDADHKIELCVGGADCAKTNGQWLESGPNRASGPKVYNQVKDDPIGTVYSDVTLEE